MKTETVSAYKRVVIAGDNHVTVRKPHLPYDAFHLRALDGNGKHMAGTWRRSP
ncbi:hypothetical protein OSG44_003991 [Enterobacter mori]|nr:hypothetical protein [Enterobacter mori]EKS6730535.1 hypothetical protein [Enterobacter mori]